MNMSSTDESFEATLQTPNENTLGPEALKPRFEKEKRKKKKQDVSPASRYFRKPVIADSRHVYQHLDRQYNHGV